MKFKHLLIPFSFIVMAAAGAKADEPAKGSLLIRNVHIVTADAKASKQRLNLLIEQDRIRAIGTQEFKAEQVIEGEGQYLIPGLIDSHVHLRDVPGLMVPENERATSKLYQEAAAQIPKSYLYAGFTTLLDLINDKQFIDQWNSQQLAPQAYFCSPVFVPQGYPAALLPKEVQDAPVVSRHYLHDKHSHNEATLVDADEHTPLKLVAAAKSEGARCIKAFYEKGFGAQRNLPVPSEAIVRELVTAAHNQNLPVFLHGNSQWSYEFALKTGVDMLVHGMWNGDANTNKELPQIAHRLVKAGIAIQPTVQVIYGEQELFNPTFFQQPYLKHVMPTALLNWYQSDDGQWMNREIGAHVKDATTQIPEQEYKKVKDVYAPLLERTKLLTQLIHTQQKTLLVFGTDTPSGPIYTQFPGFNGRKEMDRWIDMGIPLVDLFKAMTIGNAQRIGLENEIGSVAKNKVANLLLLGKNPLEDVTAYDSIKYVILKGKAIKREDLSALKSK
ncbi:integrase [Cellvibrio zantedeschiae]|uniref:Integrase n=1 Tax=Cellvibrio zantedeschiae TaxID=1237077 RepID=A0ABQ3AQD7_9GAMM|nr:amidohydrolase family protein [Cellvibrio zantedeschiae]GGY64562.1 integrase [Cellvibrio zantedeschiae]